MADIVMPQAGQTMEEGTIVRWLKSVGDKVEKGEVILEVETDKAVIEVEAFTSGIITEILAEEGRTVPILEKIGTIAEEGEQDTEAPPPTAQVEQTEQETAAEEQAEPEQVAQDAVAAESARPPVSPRARRVAEERGIDLSKVQPSKPGARITEEDVLAYAGQQGEAAGVTEQTPKAEPAPAPKPSGEDKVQPMSSMRRTIAARMQQSKQTIPHFYVSRQLDMEKVVRFRREQNSKFSSPEDKISVTDLLIKATASALRAVPQLNAVVREDELILKGRVNVGLAVAVPDGLVVPVVENADGKSPAEIARNTKQIVENAKQGKMSAAESTFTISNLGMYGVESFAAVINPPEVGILAVSSMRKVPVVEGDGIFVRQRMNVCVSVDHRAADGVLAAQFLAEIQEALDQLAESASE